MIHKARSQVRIKAHLSYVSEGGEGRTEIVCFEVFQQTIASDEQSQTFCGSEFQVVRAEIRKASEPSERLWHRM